MNENINVLFVCLGNICRSPTAHGVFLEKVKQRELGNKIFVDSCGTGDWHIGRAPDSRSQEIALASGYDLSSLTARQLVAQDYNNFDFIFAMDNSNLDGIQQVFSGQNIDTHQPVIDLFLRYSLSDYEKDSSIVKQLEACAYEVPDPYYGGADGFATVLSLVETACDELLDNLTRKLA